MKDRKGLRLEDRLKRKGGDVEVCKAIFFRRS